VGSQRRVMAARAGVALLALMIAMMGALPNTTGRSATTLGMQPRHNSLAKIALPHSWSTQVLARPAGANLHGHLAVPVTGRSGKIFSWVIDSLPTRATVLSLSGCWASRATRFAHAITASGKPLQATFIGHTGILSLPHVPSHSSLPLRLTVVFVRPLRAANPAAKVFARVGHGVVTLIMGGPACPLVAMTPRSVPAVVAQRQAHPIGQYPPKHILAVNLALTLPGHGALTVSKSVVAATRAWATRAGLTVDGVDAVAGIVSLHGPTARLSRAFGAPIENYRLGAGKTTNVFFANSRPLTFPHGLGIVAVSGLSDVPSIRGLAATSTTVNGDCPNSSNCLKPDKLLRAYDVQGDAQGQTIGIVLWGGPISAADRASFQRDLDAFAAQTGTRPLRYGDRGDDTLSWQVVDRRDSHSSAPNQLMELATDVEYAHAMAPRSHILVWLARSHLTTDGASISDDVGMEHAMAAAAGDRSVSIVSNSWGNISAAEDRGFALIVDRYLSLAQQRGATFLFGSGDYGSLSGCPNREDLHSCPSITVSVPPPDPSGPTVPLKSDPVYIPLPPYPAENVNVLAVGATHMRYDTLQEYAWGWSALSGPPPQSSGGGCSFFAYSRPSWQIGVGNDPCGVGYRAVPDVAAFGSALPGAYIVTRGAGTDVHGTSVATPLWAGMLADLERYLHVHGQPPTGFASPGLYRLATNPVTYRRDFHDETEYLPLDQTNGYPARQGWDAVTGWGSPDLAHLEEDWAATDGGLHAPHDSRAVKPVPPSVVPGRWTVAPHITSVQFSGTGQSLHIVVQGSGFGLPPVSMPFSGDLQCYCFNFYDLTRIWTAGHFGDGVQLNYASWSQMRIVIDGFAGAYGGSWIDTPGDHVQIFMMNAKTRVSSTWDGHLPSPSKSSSPSLGPTWDTSSPPSPQGLGRPAVTLGHDGNIYAFGGLKGPDGSAYNTTYIYRIRSKSWVEGAAMPLGREGAQAVTLPDGRIVVLGGGVSCVNHNLCDNGHVYNRVDVYNPATNSWGTLASMRNPRYRFAAVVHDGQVYVIGGSNGTMIMASVEIYNSSSNKWMTGVALPQPLEGADAVVEKDGHIDVVGGFSVDDGPILHSLNRFDGRTWQSGPPLLQSMEDGAATLGPDGHIYVIGGYSGGGSIAAVQAYDPRRDSWLSVAPLPSPRCCLGAVTTSNGQIYAVGGIGTFGPPQLLTQVAAYSPSTTGSRVWTPDVTAIFETP